MHVPTVLLTNIVTQPQQVDGLSHADPLVLVSLWQAMTRAYFPNYPIHIKHVAKKALGNTWPEIGTIIGKKCVVLLPF